MINDILINMFSSKYIVNYPSFGIFNKLKLSFFSKGMLTHGNNDSTKTANFVRAKSKRGEKNQQPNYLPNENKSMVRKRTLL